MRFLRLTQAILSFGFTMEIASAFCPAVTVAPTTIHGVSVSNGTPSWQQSNSQQFSIPSTTRRSRNTSRSLHVLQSAKIIPYVFRSVGVGLAYKAFKLQIQSKNTLDALVLLMTGLMSYFNFATKDNDRLKAAKRAVKRFDKHSEEDLKEDAEIVSAAKIYKSAIRVKIFYQFLSLVCMGLAKTSRELYLGAGAVVGSTIVFLVMGGGRFQHNASGRLNPVSDEFIAKAYKLDLSILVAAIAAAFLKTPSVVRQICAAYIAFGYFGAALQEMAPKSKAKKELNKAMFGKNTPSTPTTNDDDTESKNTKE